MPKEDYLLKYLEKLSRVIAAMAGLREKGCPDEALSLADEVYTELIDCKLDDLLEMPLDKFKETIRKIGYSASYIDALSRLLVETAASFRMKENDRFALVFYRKALESYLLLNEKDKTFSFDREQTIVYLKEIIQQI